MLSPRSGLVITEEKGLSKLRAITERLVIVIRERYNRNIIPA